MEREVAALALRFVERGVGEQEQLARGLDVELRKRRDAHRQGDWNRSPLAFEPQRLDSAGAARRRDRAPSAVGRSASRVNSSPP
jgi:hypothetical protein